MGYNGLMIARKWARPLAFLGCLVLGPWTARASTQHIKIIWKLRSSVARLDDVDIGRMRAACEALGSALALGAGPWGLGLGDDSGCYVGERHLGGIPLPRGAPWVVELVERMEHWDLRIKGRDATIFQAPGQAGVTLPAAWRMPEILASEGFAGMLADLLLEDLGVLGLTRGAPSGFRATLRPDGAAGRMDEGRAPPPELPVLLFGGDEAGLWRPVGRAEWRTGQWVMTASPDHTALNQWGPSLLWIRDPRGPSERKAKEEALRRAYANLDRTLSNRDFVPPVFAERLAIFWIDEVGSRPWTSAERSRRQDIALRTCESLGLALSRDGGPWGLGLFGRVECHYGRPDRPWDKLDEPWTMAVTASDGGWAMDLQYHPRLFDLEAPKAEIQVPVPRRYTELAADADFMRLVSLKIYSGLGWVGWVGPKDTLQGGTPMRLGRNAAPWTTRWGDFPPPRSMPALRLNWVRAMDTYSGGDLREGLRFVAGDAGQEGGVGSWQIPKEVLGDNFLAHVVATWEPDPAQIAAMDAALAAALEDMNHVPKDGAGDLSTGQMSELDALFASPLLASRLWLTAGKWLTESLPDLRTVGWFELGFEPRSWLDGPRLHGAVSTVHKSAASDELPESRFRITSFRGGWSLPINVEDRLRLDLTPGGGIINSDIITMTVADPTVVARYNLSLAPVVELEVGAELKLWIIRLRGFSRFWATANTFAETGTRIVEQTGGIASEWDIPPLVLGRRTAGVFVRTSWTREHTLYSNEGAVSDLLQLMRQGESYRLDLDRLTLGLGIWW